MILHCFVPFVFVFLVYPLFLFFSFPCDPGPLVSMVPFAPVPMVACIKRLIIPVPWLDILAFEPTMSRFLINALFFFSSLVPCFICLTFSSLLRGLWVLVLSCGITGNVARLRPRTSPGCTRTATWLKNRPWATYVSPSIPMTDRPNHPTSTGRRVRRSSCFLVLPTHLIVTLFVHFDSGGGFNSNKRNSLPYRMIQKPGMKAMLDQMERETPRPKSPHMNNEEPIELAHYPNADRWEEKILKLCGVFCLLNTFLVRDRVIRPASSETTFPHRLTLTRIQSAAGGGRNPPKRSPTLRWATTIAVRTIRGITSMGKMCHPRTIPKFRLDSIKTLFFHLYIEKSLLLCRKAKRSCRKSPLASAKSS